MRIRNKHSTTGELSSVNVEQPVNLSTTTTSELSSGGIVYTAKDENEILEAINFSAIEGNKNGLDQFQGNQFLG